MTAQGSVQVSRRAWFWLPISFGLAATLVVSVFLAHRGADAAPRRIDDQVAMLPEATAGVAPLRAPSQEILAELGSVKVIAEPVLGVTPKAVITVEKAAEIAHVSMGRIVDGAGAAAGPLFLARVTVPDYGKQLESDPTKPSRIDPVIEDRLAWVLVYEGARVPVLGGSLTSHDKDANEPTGYATQLVVVLDARTGEFLVSSSF